MTKTPAGQQVLKDRSVALTPRQRTLLILADGKRPVAELLQSSGAGPEDVDRLLELALIEDAGAATVPAALAPTPTAAEPEAAPAGADGRSAQERYAQAYPIAVRLTGELGLRGFRLNLSVEGATNYEELVALAPKIRDAVGPQKFAPLEAALGS